MPQVEPREAKGTFVKKEKVLDPEKKTVSRKKVTVKRDAIPISSTRGKFWSHIARNL